MSFFENSSRSQSTQPTQPPSSSTLPTILKDFRTTALYIAKSGREKYITVVQCPRVTSKIENGPDKDAAIAFYTWWEATDSAVHEKVKPHWNSTARRGEIWNRFGEACHHETGFPYVYCLRCGNLLQHPSVGAIGTTHLLKHLNTRSCLQTEIPKHDFPAPESPLRSSKRPCTTQAYNSASMEYEIVRVVLDNNWSFRTVERPSFQRFISFLRPEAAIITRYKFGEWFKEQCSVAKKGLLQDLGPKTKLSIALDAWSASNHLSFLAIKAYYINDQWQLREVLIDFIPMRGNHTGSSMAAEVFTVLKEYKATRKFLAVTCDNASNNGTLATSLQKRLADDKVRWSPQENTIPCLAHVINLVVQDIIQHLKLAPSPELDDAQSLQQRHVSDVEETISVPNSLRKVFIFITHSYHKLTHLQLRAICIAIDVSPQRFERFISTQHELPVKKRLTVIRDVKTRWNSTYDMCERAIKLQPYIDTWLDDEIKLKPTQRQSQASNTTATSPIDFRDLQRLKLSDAEWVHLRKLTTMLENFKEATNHLSQNHTPHAPFIWQMYNRLFDFLDDMTTSLSTGANGARDDWPTVVQEAADKGRTKLSKYYGKTSEERGFLFNCAVVLDPTQKLNAYDVCIITDDYYSNHLTIRRTIHGTAKTSICTVNSFSIILIATIAADSEILLLHPLHSPTTLLPMNGSDESHLFLLSHLFYKIQMRIRVLCVRKVKPILVRL